MYNLTIKYKKNLLPDYILDCLTKTVVSVVLLLWSYISNGAHCYELSKLNTIWQ